MIIYGLKTCDTCRKARKALPEAQFVDIREAGLPEEVRDRAIAAFGDALVNSRSTTWRGMTEAERADAPEVQLGTHPALMKRPLIDDGGTLHLGWSAEVQRALGL
ncbi:ArsC/Spx/MgsR family protein [Roseivivax sediminis]|uniref:Arsenate reductase n=1 Tax=Roseivivax sediminis TaxID=936889 RepID=A0A1I1T822_9RHOB|nr:ArsC/Spx/MgsR family protein [Roseivivax sediminis]SFD54787.1 arsenate reductase [Roseivivax sediminis]